MRAECVDSYHDVHLWFSFTIATLWRVIQSEDLLTLASHNEKLPFLLCSRVGPSTDHSQLILLFKLLLDIEIICKLTSSYLALTGGEMLLINISCTSL